MKSFLLISYVFAIILLSSNPTHAQNPFPTSADQAEWGVQIVEIGMMNFPQVERVHYAHDTVVNGVSYAKYNGLRFYATFPTLPTSPFSFLIRTQGQKVYQRTGNRDRLLYDFDLQAGDSVWLPSTSDSTGRDSVLTSVDSITTEVNQGISRRVFHLTYPSHDPLGVLYPWYSAWVEGVGSIEGPAYRLNRTNAPWVDNENSALACHRKNGVLSYLLNSLTSCPAILSTQEPVEPNQDRLELSVFPNPAAGAAYLRYHLPVSGLATISALDLLGRPHFVKQVQQDAGEHKLQLPELSHGVYFVVVEVAGQRQLVRYVKE